jgi:hypothetical protein
MNNQIFGGTINLYDTGPLTITGTTVSNSQYGIHTGPLLHKIPTVKNCTFKNCQYAVYFQGWGGDPGKLTTFSGNKYINNKHNFGWDSNEF